jgi:hypothetical protein
MRFPSTRPRGLERGATIYLVAASLVALLLLAGLAIDLATLYVARSQAQRAADAGALAGADIFSSSGCTLTTSCLTPSVETSAEAEATAVAQQNLVFGQTPTVPTPTFTSGGGSSTDPLITVIVQATVPTFFMRLAGVTSENISAKATAEAFDPGDSGCYTCLKPFFLPNCDPNNPADPKCGAAGSVPNQSNIRGEQWSLHTSSASSKWLAVSFSEQPLGTTEGSKCSGTMSQNQFEQSVMQCTTASYACGSELCAQDGKGVGPVGHSVGCLISYGQKCTSQSVTSTDALTSVNPLSITPGTGSKGSTTQSASLMTVPIYDGTNVGPGTSSGLTVTIVGYMQVFVRDVTHSGPDDLVDVTVLNVIGCGTGGAGGNGNGCSAVGGGASFVPVRLVQNP